jgi:integrase/recombinase XerD
MGRRYTNNARELRAFARRNAGIALAAVRNRHISMFLNSQPIGRWTWINKYARLRAFFAYWLSRHEITRLPMPRPRRAGQCTFSPYIFSYSELRALLNRAPEIQNRKLSVVGPETFRMLVVLLYATGMWVEEALSLRWRDVDLTNAVVTLRSKIGKPREIPIGSDLSERLKNYLVSSREQDFVLATKHGGPISTHRAARHFRRTRCLAGISRAEDVARQPGLRDLRHTFAVHRICQWYGQRANLELMLPRLSTYMGLHAANSTERYLSLSPKHFQRHVNKLSKGLPVF